MPRNIIASFLVGCLIFTAGCDLWIAGNAKKGYRIEIKTEHISSDDLSQVEETLVDEGYVIVFSERKISEGYGVPRYPGEVYSQFRKILNENSFAVDVYISYVKDTSNNVVQNPRIMIENWFQGGIVPEITNEIDRVGDIVYNELTEKLGKDRVSLVRFGAHPNEN